MRRYLFIIAVSVCVNYSCTNNNSNSNNNTKDNSIVIGHLLFFDTDLSITATKSCGSCHDPKQYFTDGYKRTLGVYADVQMRNTPSIINSAYKKSLNWADPHINTFVQQMATPLFSKAHVEMGMDAKNMEQVNKIISKPIYKNLLGATQHVDWNFLQKCISEYCSKIVSRKSIYDNYLAKQTNLTAQQLLGKQLFFSTKTKCSFCHGGIDFNSPTDTNLQFVNTGLYNINGAYANADNGVANGSKLTKDIGKFAIPSLRNVEHTAPYYHDGSATNLLDIITNYSNGGRNISTGIWQGNGSNHANKSNLISGFIISETEKKALISFLYTLTDTSVLHNSLFANPF